MLCVCSLLNEHLSVTNTRFLFVNIWASQAPRLGPGIMGTVCVHVEKVLNTYVMAQLLECFHTLTGVELRLIHGR